MPYAICETLDEHASKLQGPAIILNEEEMAMIRVAVDLMQRTMPYNGLILGNVSDALLNVLAKLQYLACREKPSAINKQNTEKSRDQTES